jgi:hypothetical protein
VREWISSTPNNAGVATGFDCIAVDACLSKLNHRLYRQGRKYRVKVDLELDDGWADKENRLEVYALMPTWYVHSMWKQAKKAFDDAMALEKKALNKSNLARWRDFRVKSGWFPSAPGLTPPASGTQFPIAFTPLGAQVEFTAGEFNYSLVENLDTNNSMDFSFGQGDTTTFSLPVEYSLTRNESASPETVITEAPYNELNSNLESDDYALLQANGNEPPYNALAFPDALWVRIAVLGTDYVGAAAPSNAFLNRISTGYFDAPCGYVALKSNFDDDSVSFGPKIKLEVQSGDYRGVKATPM